MQCLGCKLISGDAISMSQIYGKSTLDLFLKVIRVEDENTRLRHYLAWLHRKTLCYSKSEEMLRHSVRLLIHYLKYV